jgi:hypothetical protein
VASKYSVTVVCCVFEFLMFPICILLAYICKSALCTLFLRVWVYTNGIFCLVHSSSSSMEIFCEFSADCKAFHFKFCVWSFYCWWDTMLNLCSASMGWFMAKNINIYSRHGNTRHHFHDFTFLPWEKPKLIFRQPAKSENLSEKITSQSSWHGQLELNNHEYNIGHSIQATHFPALCM